MYEPGSSRTPTFVRRQGLEPRTRGLRVRDFDVSISQSMLHRTDVSGFGATPVRYRGAL